MSHRDKRGGTLIIDREFRHVGRIKRASGTDNPRVRRKMDRMLTHIHDEGRYDVLRAIRHGQLTIAKVYELYTEKGIEGLPSADTARPLAAAWLQWVLEKECSTEHKRSLVQSLRHLLGAEFVFSVTDPPPVDAAVAKLPKSARAWLVEDLDDLAARARKRLQLRARSWNLLRAACQAFVRETLRRSHPLWLAVADMKPLKVEPKRKKRPQTVKGLIEVTGELDPDASAAVWSMATTGMNPKEYWGRWEHVKGVGIRIHGTKRDGRRERLIPDLGMCTRPRLSRQALEDRLVAAGAKITPMDCRRTFMNWMERAGIIRARRRLYMGHGARDVSDLYEWHEVLEFLVSDTATLVDWIERERTASPTKSPTKRRKKKTAATT